MILITTCYTIVTPESAEDGYFADSGILSEDIGYSFREIVELIRGKECSCWPPSGDTDEWLTEDQGETRKWFELGEREERSFHYPRHNPPRNAKYWRWAFRAAGLIR